MGNSRSSGKPPSKSKYAVRLGQQPKDQSQVLKHPKYVTTTMTTPYPGLLTIDACLLKSFNENKDRPCLGTRKGDAYDWKTYNQILTSAVQLGSALVVKEFCPKLTTDGFDVAFIAIYMNNREEWHTAEVACALYDIATVPLYDTLGESAVEFILNQTELNCVLASNDKLKRLLDMKKQGKVHHLKYLIVIDSPTEEELSQAHHLKLELISYKDILKFGSERQAAFIPATPKSIYTLSYTSGTTGNPKGVVMTHSNLLSQITGIFDVFTPSSDDVHISYLPLAHLYERLVGGAMLMTGARIGYLSGDVSKLKDDLSVLRPTVFVAVPRVLNKFYDLIRQNFEKLPGFTQKLVKKAVSVKLAATKTQAVYTHGFYDKLIFNKIKSVLGGRVRIAVTASAPIDQNVLNFLKVTLSCQIIEAYGQTECGGACTATYSDDNTLGHVGGPLGCASLKLIDIPEMNYFTSAANPCGEICIRGPTVMPKYFKNPEATSEVIDSQKWLHSGDVGMLLPTGALKIIDRKKNIYKLSQGEYIAPEKIENIYSKCELVALVYVYGDSMKDFSVAIVVPNKENVLKLAEKAQVSGTWEQICENPIVVEGVLSEMKKLGNLAGLNSIEQVRKIYLHSEEIGPGSGLLTPTFKVKRVEMRNHFSEVIRKLYS